VCEACWVNYGMPVVFDEDVAEVVGLIKKLLELDDTGGPLHPYLDDLNVSGDKIVPIYDSPGSHIYSPDIRDLCDEIAQRLTGMPDGWRASAVAHAHGWAIRGHPLKDQTDMLQDL
jgi:hypothetical protein